MVIVSYVTSHRYEPNLVVLNFLRALPTGFVFIRNNIARFVFIYRGSLQGESLS